MQRVSAFLPSWDKRNSTNTAANSNRPPATGGGGGGGGVGAPAPAGGGGGFFGWSNRTSTTSVKSNGNGVRSSIRNSGFASLARINVNAANASSAAATAPGSIQSRVQREAFWPATLELECEKAARIIKSFCADGFLAPSDDAPTPELPEDAEPPTPVPVSKKIPKRIIQNAAGIAVFTCMRSGLWMTGSGGSGILIARKSDGTWSPPSGIMLHTPTLSFIIGVDVYDCVLVINSLAALESITRPTVTLGEDVGLTAGPLVTIDPPATEDGIDLRSLDNTVLTYMKSRGQAQFVNMNGCILTERANENERFYEAPVTQMDVLAGNVSRHVDETRPLFEVIKLAEGRSDFDPAAVGKVAAEPAPGDATIASPASLPQSPRRPNAFGMPQADDPDPFGVLALEMAGMEIREAGTRLRPASSQMDFQTRPASSAMSKHYRQSGDTFLTRSNRESYMSTRTIRSQMTDAHTQTDTANTPETSPSPGRSEDGHVRSSFPGMISEVKERDNDDEVDYTTVDLTPLKHLSQPRVSEDVAAATTTSINGVVATADHATETKDEETSTDLAPPPPIRDDNAAAAATDKLSKASSNYGEDDEKDASDDHDEGSDASDDDEEEEEEEPVIFEVAEVQPARTQAVASRMIQAKGSMVTIPKRIPPPLPVRNPARGSMAGRSDASGDGSSVRSPLRRDFSSSDLNGGEQGSQSLQQDPASNKTVAEDAQSQTSSSSSSSHLSVPVVGKFPEEEDEEHLVVDTRSVDPVVSNAEEAKSPEDGADAETLHAEEKSTAEEAESKSVEAGDVVAKDSAPKTEDALRDGEEPVASPSDMLDSKVDDAEEKKDVDRLEKEEQKDGSESHLQGRLSTDTGATEAHSSIQESPYTTPPTSERRNSTSEDESKLTTKPSTTDVEEEPAAPTTSTEEDKKDALREEPASGNAGTTLA